MKGRARGGQTEFVRDADDRKHRPGAADAKYSSDDDRLAIYQGITAFQLAEMFRTTAANVLRKLGPLQPSGVNRRGNPIYSIPEAARLLLDIEPTAEMIEHFMLSAQPKDLPPSINRAYWEGMKSKLIYREKADELWETADVLEAFGTAIQTFALAARLIPDSLRDEIGLTDAQFKIVQQSIDIALEQIYDDLVRNLRKPSQRRAGRNGAEEGTIPLDS